MRAILTGAMLALLAGPAPAQTGTEERQSIPFCDTGAVTYLIPDEKRHVIPVELADTPALRARGLMFRRSLPPGAGMLFIYEHPQPVAFWMRNTLIPLDMVFMDASGTIRLIHRGAQPRDETPILGHRPGDPDPNRQFVLELTAGDADRLMLREGMALAHPAIAPATAALPCD